MIDRFLKSLLVARLSYFAVFVFCVLVLVASGTKHNTLSWVFVGFQLVATVIFTFCRRAQR